MTIECPECFEMVEPYDGGEANDCALWICPECGCDFADPNTCWHTHTFEDTFDNGELIIVCEDCRMIVGP